MSSILTHPTGLLTLLLPQVPNENKEMERSSAIFYPKSLQNILVKLSNIKLLNRNQGILLREGSKFPSYCFLMLSHAEI